MSTARIGRQQHADSLSSSSSGAEYRSIEPVARCAGGRTMKCLSWQVDNTLVRAKNRPALSGTFNLEKRELPQGLPKGTSSPASTPALGYFRRQSVR
jgi:hypothetical protein